MAGLINNEDDIFLIDNRATEKHDFPRLKDSIADNLIQRNDYDELIVDLLKNNSKDAIEMKTKLLKGMFCDYLISYS